MEAAPVGVGRVVVAGEAPQHSLYRSKFNASSAGCSPGSIFLSVFSITGGRSEGHHLYTGSEYASRAGLPSESLLRYAL